MKKIDILDLSPKELEDLVSGLGERPYRVSQLARWIYKKNIRSFEEMTDLSKGFRSTLKDVARLSSIRLRREQTSRDGTKKFLFELEDGSRIESVLIPDAHRLTLCISTQVGCLMGCAFCLTARLRRIRNLSPGEIVDQFLAVRELSPYGVTNIVFMGMGEPLDNFESTVKAIEILTHPGYVGMSPRRVTVSTSGLVPEIAELGERAPVNLSISLNASNDRLRSRLMPVNNKYPLKTLIEAGASYPLGGRGKLTFEYVLIKDVNDAKSNAVELVGLLRGIRCMVNLIPYNEAPPLEYQTPERDRALQFQKVLIDGGIRAMIRKSRGRDILGACGQLVADYPLEETGARSGAQSAAVAALPS